ncbi:NADP-dependent oxidoreductase YfmJ [Apiospora phragmitis]|uniref:NADP-dependent oxidoreductase YfmJ n=1 Tax=Apiospora phragmitis TaxID=2905665 RepID=A0ABR1VSG4_9PEZI
MSRPTETRRWVLAKKPAGLPVLSGPDATFRLETVPLPPLQAGQLLCKARYFSNDAGQRGFIESPVPADRYYINTVPLGEPMFAGVIAEVVEAHASVSESHHQLGQLVMSLHMGVWSEYFVLDAAHAQPVVPNGKIAMTHHLGAFGGPGLAAYTGLHYAARIKPDDIVVVSAAAGATGSVAVQIAANLVGCRRVVGIAGGEAKCAWVRSLLSKGNDNGAQHACVDYKSPHFAADLKRATEGGNATVYFDNVGGDVLDTVLGCMARAGRVAVCGAVSTYNNNNAPMALRNWFEIVNRRLTLQGFILLDFADKLPGAVAELGEAAATGRLRLDGASETVVEVGIEGVPAVWLRLYSGLNQGKLVTKLVV